MQLGSLEESGVVNLTLVREEDLEAKKIRVNSFLRSIRFPEVSHIDPSGFSAVMFAVIGDDEDALELLLDDPDVTPQVFRAKNSAGETAIHYTALRGRVGCLKLLLNDSRVTPDMVRTKAKRGVTAMQEARACGH